jgi:hypothetical protein
LSTVERKKKVDKAHKPPVSRQCVALNISRSSAYRNAAGVSAEDIDLMRKLDELHLKRPFKGSRRLREDNAPQLAAQRLPLFVSGTGDQPGQSSLVHGSDLYPNAQAFPVSGCHNGLAF